MLKYFFWVVIPKKKCHYITEMIQRNKSTIVASIGKLYAKVNDYAQDNYYTKDAGLENSQWYGRGASILGLQGRVLTEDYNRAYGGIDPQGLPLRQRQSGKKANPGRDITLSAPKSVSLLSLVKEDKKVVEAHQQIDNSLLNHLIEIN